ncbi:hypothetical protein IW261DRAFT_1419672 [Armillaria novae-zelandiae]|uniref:Cytochrome P450 n=1 Tax=Armillaria novae-zelandiae TaxID=153914 RepID=A0AA39UEU2_9AGAR|nr:hypothetical protein IW261DRAFT_1419672 [Armillaria novae-zelandiae]
MNGSLTTLAIVVISVASLVFAYRLLYQTCRNTPFPPGPKGLPFIRNILDVPSEKEWLTFARWSEKYGDIMSVSVLGRRMVVINSVQTAIDILDKKGAIYSNRPMVAMSGGLVGWKNGMNVANIMQISYGYDIQKDNDLFLKLAGEAANHFSLSINLVRHIPAWFPGAKFKQTAKKWRSTVLEVVELPYNYAKQQISSVAIQMRNQSSKREGVRTYPRGFRMKVFENVGGYPAILTRTRQNFLETYSARQFNQIADTKYGRSRCATEAIR